MQETDATIITSLVSNNDNVAECLNLSISSLIEESFSIYVSLGIEQACTNFRKMCMRIFRNRTGLY